MFPASRIGRVLAALWLISCVSLLAFAYIQRDIHDMPVAFTLLNMFITAPIGIIVIPLMEMATASVSSLLGLSYSTFFSLLPSWVTAVSLGYLQWFVVVPKLISWCK